MPSHAPPSAVDFESPRSLRERLLVRLLHIYFRFARGLTFGVRAAVLNERDEVFLVRHSYVSGWYLPGGGVEVGETAAEALERELAEEAGLALAGPAVLHGIFLNRRTSPRDHVALYIVRDFRPVSIKRADREIAEAGFFPLDALPEGTTPATRRRLDEILTGTPSPAEW